MSRETGAETRQLVLTRLALAPFQAWEAGKEAPSLCAEEEKEHNHFSAIQDAVLGWQCSLAPRDTLLIGQLESV